MNEAEYFASEFTDSDLNAQADAGEGPSGRDVYVVGHPDGHAIFDKPSCFFRAEDLVQKRFQANSLMEICRAIRR